MEHLLKTTRPKLSPWRTKSKHYFSPYVRLVGGNHSLIANPHNLPGLDRTEVGEAIRNQRQKVFQQDRLSAKNDNRNLSLPHILLVFESPINREDNIEFRSLGHSQKLTVFKSCKTSISGCLTVMIGEIVAQSLVHTLIKENPHSRLGG
jgi:hypothetical protein